MNEPTCAICGGPLDNPQLCDPEYDWHCAACDAPEETLMTQPDFLTRVTAAMKNYGAVPSDASDVLRDLLDLGADAETAWVNPDTEGGYGVACAFSAAELPEVLDTLDLDHHDHPFVRASEWLDAFERD